MSAIFNRVTSVFNILLRLINSIDNTRRHQHLLQQLTRLQAVFTLEMDFRDNVLRQNIQSIRQSVWSGKENRPTTEFDTSVPLSDTQSLFTFTDPLCILAPLAELRAWQQAAHRIACIETTISYISNATTEDPDELTEKIRNTMVSTVFSFPLPPTDRRPALQQPDDHERVMDRLVFYDEPPMRKLIASFDDESRLLLKSAVERERAHLPLFPPYLRLWVRPRLVLGSDLV